MLSQSPSPFDLSPISQLHNMECQSDFLTPSSKIFPQHPRSAKSGVSERTTLSKLLFARTNKKLQNHTFNISNSGQKSPTTEFIEQLNKEIKDLHQKFQRYDENAMTIEQDYADMKRYCRMNDTLEANNKCRNIDLLLENQSRDTIPVGNTCSLKSYYKEYQDAVKLSQDMHTEFTRFMLTTDKTISKVLSDLDQIFQKNSENMNMAETLSLVENYANTMQADIWGALSRVTRFPDVLVQLHSEVREILGYDDIYKQEYYQKEKRIAELEGLVSTCQQEIAELKARRICRCGCREEDKQDLQDKKEIQRLIELFAEVVKMQKGSHRNGENLKNEFSDDDDEEKENRDDCYWKTWTCKVLWKKVKAGMDSIKRSLKKDLRRDYSTECYENEYSNSDGDGAEKVEFNDVSYLENQFKELKKMRKELKKNIIAEKKKKEEGKIFKVNFEEGVLETDEDDGGLKERSTNVLLKEEEVKKNRSKFSRRMDKRLEKFSSLYGKENPFQFSNSLLHKRSSKFLEDGLLIEDGILPLNPKVDVGI